MINIAFFGTSQFAANMLSALNALSKSSKYILSMVVCKPIKDNDSLNQHSVKYLLKSLKHIKLYQPNNLKITKKEGLYFYKTFIKLKIDLVIVTDYGFIIPNVLLKQPKYGFIGIHPSLLPQFRGASPIQYTILNKIKYSGISIIKLNKRMDAGDIFYQKKIIIKSKDTNTTLKNKLINIGKKIIFIILPYIIEKKIFKIPQNHKKASYTFLMIKSSGEINFKEPANFISKYIKALEPWPGSYTFHNNNQLKILKAKEIKISYKKKYFINNQYGSIVKVNKQNILVQTGVNLLSLQLIQLENRKKMWVNDFINGYLIKEGDILGNK